MIEYIKRCFCKHGNMEIITVQEWIAVHYACSEVVREPRQYLICKKCGYKRKISNR